MKRLIFDRKSYFNMKYYLFLFSVFFFWQCQNQNASTTSEVEENATQIQETPEPEPLTLVWADEFEGSELNMENWSFEIGDGCPNLCGWGNNELQVYTDSNHRIEEGKLIISAKKQNGYTSTRIISKGKKEFQYGRIEARLKVPSGAGLWPAFWALGNDIDVNSWPDCGEIDIMEYVGRNPNEVLNAIHTRSSYGNTVNKQVTSIAGFEDEFHVIKLEWNSAFMDFFVDDQLLYRYGPQLKTAENWPFNKPIFLILNLAVGGNLGGTVDSNLSFPREYEIDYIRVYQ